MRVALIGVGGVGTVIARELAARDYVEKVILADIRTDHARRLAQELGEPRFEVRQVDAGDAGSAAQGIEGCDVVINATLPAFNLVIMEAALANGAHYVDLGSHGPVRLPGRIDLHQQLSYDERFRRSGRSALLCLGMDPGCSNVFARYLADRLDEVEAIIVYDGDNSQVEGYEFALFFSPDTNIEECLQPVLVFRDGQYVLGDPLETGVDVFRFPDPVGPMKVYSVSHEEVATLPGNIGKGIRHCDFKYALSDRVVTALHVFKWIGLHRPEPIDVKGCRVAPRDVVTALLPTPVELAGKVRGYSCIGTVVRGKAGGGKKEYFMYTMGSHEEAFRRMGVNMTVYQTGLPAVVGVDFLAAGRVPKAGVVMPEELDPEPFLRRVKERGLDIYLEETSRSTWR